MILQQNHMGYLSSPPGGAAFDRVGMRALTTTGCTLTARTMGVGLYTKCPRIGLVGTGAVAGSILTARHGLNSMIVGGYPATDAFLFHCRFGISDAAAVPNARMFIGLTNQTTALTNVDPATLTNVAGIGHNSGDANLSLYISGSTAQAAIDLGVGYPANTNSADWYDLVISSYSLGGDKYKPIVWAVSRRGWPPVSGVAFAPPGSSGVPTPNGPLGFNMFRSNNTSTGAVSVDLMGMRMELKQ